MSLDGPASDETLLQAATQGDHRAYSALAERHLGAVLAAATRILGDRDLAMDVAQEALLRGWRSLAEFRGESSFRGWIVKIAVNAALNEKRRRRPTLGESGDEDWRDTRERSPEDAAMDRELRTAFEAALADLPEPLRAALHLREVEDMAYKDIAEALGIPMGTVMSRLHKARLRLQESLRQFMGRGD